MPSLRSKFWSIIISRLIMKAGEINGPDDIRRDMSGDKISFLRDNWKKEEYIDYINDFIGSLEILKLNNKKVTSNKTLLYLHGGGYVACGAARAGGAAHVARRSGRHGAALAAWGTDAVATWSLLPRPVPAPQRSRGFPQWSFRCASPRTSARAAAPCL